ncbi:hypothetical protein [Streptomyces sp. Tue 6075]|uniref:hypothetical protein n=1 Tax=Streptomyces sp. Tue 6075 TaxID=1661694 RepID=UPI00094B4A1E|nr:hypothetical protein [Streptomyces sp. Tue 6075]
MAFPVAPFAGLVLSGGVLADRLYALRPGAVPAPPPGESLWRDLAVGRREFPARGWLRGVIVMWMFYAVLSRWPQLSVAAGVIVPERGARPFGLINAGPGRRNRAATALLAARPIRTLRRMPDRR